jgi:hypothetical protein
VGGGRKAEDDDIGFRIAKARNGTPPILFFPEGGPLLPRHLLAPRNQTRAKQAGDDLSFESGEVFTV